jgi:hypothetical protein
LARPKGPPGVEKAWKKSLTGRDEDEKGAKKTGFLQIMVIYFALFAYPAYAGPFSMDNFLFRNPERYDYVPSVIYKGDYQHFWWCGGPEPRDVIYYRYINVKTQQWSPVYAALRPSPGSWDSAYVCDPSVVMGDFVFEGRHYRYAMYYTGTDELEGTNNGVGVAFSEDGIKWVKSPHSILRSVGYLPYYGYGQAAVLSADGKSSVWLWVLQRLEAHTQHYHLYYSPDGLSLEYMHRITENGVTGNFITEADFVYDYATGNVYMITDRINATSTIDLYTLHWSEQAYGRWTRLASISRGLTGAVANHGAGFLRNEFGNVTPWLPFIEVFFAAGSCYCDPISWDLWWAIMILD